MDTPTYMVMYFIMIFAAVNGLTWIALGLLALIMIGSKMDMYLIGAALIGLFIFLAIQYWKGYPTWVILLGLFVVLVLLNRKEEKARETLEKLGMMGGGAGGMGY